MSDMPGNRLPADGDTDTQIYEERGVDISATGATKLVRIPADRVEIVRVVTSENTGFNFNITLGGNDVFSGEQTADADPKTYTPDQNDTLDGVDSANIEVDISSAGAGTADFALEVEQR